MLGLFTRRERVSAIRKVTKWVGLQFQSQRTHLSWGETVSELVLSDAYKDACLPPPHVEFRVKEQATQMQIIQDCIISHQWLTIFSLKDQLSEFHPTRQHWKKSHIGHQFIERLNLHCTERDIYLSYDHAAFSVMLWISRRGCLCIYRNRKLLAMWLVWKSLVMILWLRFQ